MSWTGCTIVESLQGMLLQSAVLCTTSLCALVLRFQIYPQQHSSKSETYQMVGCLLIHHLGCNMGIKRVKRMLQKMLLCMAHFAMQSKGGFLIGLCVAEALLPSKSGSQHALKPANQHTASPAGSWMQVAFGLSMKEISIANNFFCIKDCSIV